MERQDERARSSATGSGAEQGNTLPVHAGITPRVSVVIPTKNEAKNLPFVLSRMARDLHEVILVDARSTDGTVEVARQLYPDIVIIEQSGRGKGDALGLGFAACTGDIIVMVDADGSADAAEIPRYVLTLCHGADFAKGSRFASGGGSADITPFRSFGNKVLTTCVNLLFGSRYTDLCYGYNAFWAHCLPYIDLDCEGFEAETLINIRIAHSDLVVHEVPSYEHGRIHGMSNLNAVRDGLRVLRTILQERFRHPIRRKDRAIARPAGYGWDGLEGRSGLDRREADDQQSFNPRSAEVRRGRRASDLSVLSLAPPQSRGVIVKPPVLPVPRGPHPPSDEREGETEMQREVPSPSLLEKPRRS